MFNPVAPSGYLLPTMYLFMADIKTCLYVVVGPGFYEEQCMPHGRHAKN